LRDRIAKSVFWITWSRLFLQGASLLSTVVVARLLSPSDYGLVAMAGICTGIVSFLAELGLGAAIVQYRDLSARDLNSCFWLTMSIAVVGYSAVYVTAPLVAWWFDTPLLADVLRVAALTLPLVALRVVPDGLLRRGLELDKVSRTEVAATIVTVPLVLCLAWMGAGVWALVAGALAAASVQSVYSLALVRWRPGIRIGGPHVKAVLGYSLGVLGSRFCWALYEQADVFVLGKVAGDAVLGSYSIAKQVALMPLEKVAGMVTQFATPIMAELQSDAEALRSAFLKSLRIVTWATFPMCIGLVLVARDLVDVVLGAKWMSAVPVIEVLCLYAMIRSVAILLPSVLLARYRVGFLFRYSAWQLMLMPVAFVAGAIGYGAFGVAVAWVTVYPILLTFMVREVLEVADLSSIELWNQLRAPLVATLAMVVCVLPIRLEWAAWPGGPSAGRLALMVGVGAGAYGAALVAWGGQSRREMQQIVGWMCRLPRPSTGR
jgi:O-antigen/teichoic acid export membrane protein